MVHNFTCEHCKKEFPNTKWQKVRKYCSFDCSLAARRQAMHQKTCPQCGKVFSYRPSQKKTCCSKACEAQQRRIPGANHNAFICEACGAEFVDAGWGKARKYCSVKCAGSINKIRVQVVCLNCGRESERQLGWAKAARSHFCNKACHNQWQTGREAPSRGGNAGIGRGPNWDQQSQLARIRDDHRCQHCGMEEKENRRSLDVHHIIPFKKFGYIPGKNDNYLLANHESNLICLCRSCHRRAETGKIPLRPRLIS